MSLQIKMSRKKNLLYYFKYFFISKKILLSIMLFFPFSILSISQISESNASEIIKINQKDRLFLNFLTDLESTKIVVNNIGLNPKIEKVISDKEIIIKIFNEKLKNNLPDLESVSLPERGIVTATLKGQDSYAELKLLFSRKIEKNQINIKSKNNRLVISLPVANDNGFLISEDIFKSPFAKKNSSKEVSKATAPPLGDIAVGTNSLPNPNLINLDGPQVTIYFKNTPAKEAIEYLISKVAYDYVWVNSNPTYIQDTNTNKNDKSIDSPRLVTLNLTNLDFSKAFNAVLMSSGLQAKLESGVIYIGPNVRNTIFSERTSKVYRLNQTSANAAASYLANLGAKVTKISTISTAITQGASQSETVSGASSASTTTESTTTTVQVYGSEIGPLVGLIATTDDRLETITLIGDPSLVDIAENFLKKLDLRQRQVALTVRILDVNLSDGKTIDNSWSMRQNNNFIVNDNGKLLAAFGSNLPPNESGGFPSVTPTENTNPAFPANILDNPGLNYANNTFLNFLKAQIESKNTKLLASPTLILNEFPGSVGGESVSFSNIADSLKTGTIGRSFGNEAFVVVGTQVPVNCTASEDSTVPSFDYGIKGLTFGARILKIDDNGFVTFAISPSINAASEQRNIVNCGVVDLLATRRLDSGTIRVRDGNTLIMTGVLNTTDTETIKKFPLLGDLPLIGQLFRNTSSSKEQNELVIMVTPQILNEKDSIYLQKNSY
ncbi:MAG: hypothetical protein CMD04_00585 [Flavobacteriales bacterium]|nr:hypothetical protein [Flavobacteriales bacterium]